MAIKEDEIVASDQGIKFYIRFLVIKGHPEEDAFVPRPIKTSTLCVITDTLHNVAALFINPVTACESHSF